MILFSILYLLIKIILGAYCVYKFFITKKITVETLWYGILLIICIVI